MIIESVNLTSSVSFRCHMNPSLQYIIISDTYAVWTPKVLKCFDNVVLELFIGMLQCIFQNEVFFKMIFFSIYCCCFFCFFCYCFFVCFFPFCWPRSELWELSVVLVLYVGSKYLLL